MAGKSDHELAFIWDLIRAFNFQAAEPRLLAMRASAPDDPRPLDALAQLYRLAGRFSEAIDAAREFAKQLPGSAHSNALLAYVYAAAARYADADASAAEAIRLSPRSTFAFWQASVAALGLDKAEQAMVFARQGLAIDPHHLVLRHLLGEALARLNRAEEAEAVVTDYLRQEPTDFNSHAAAGWTYLRLGWLDRAAERFLTALELQPSYPWQHEGLGIVRYKQGRFEDARKLLEEAARLDPAMVEGKRILDLLNAESAAQPS